MLNIFRLSDKIKFLILCLSNKIQLNNFVEQMQLFHFRTFSRPSMSNIIQVLLSIDDTPIHSVPLSGRYNTTAHNHHAQLKNVDCRLLSLHQRYRMRENLE